MTEVITLNTLRFLKALRRNNNREWFEAHKSDYQAAKKNVTAFAEAVQDGLNQTDLIAKCYVYRIYLPCCLFIFSLSVSRIYAGLGMMRIWG